jgi:hypothetical protein
MSATANTIRATIARTQPADIRCLPLFRRPGPQPDDGPP